MKKLILLLLITFAMVACSNQNATNDHKEEVVAYEYNVTTIDFIGLYGHSEDNGGIFLSPDQLPANEAITEGDTIRVYFPNESDYETILAVQKLN